MRTESDLFSALDELLDELSDDVPAGVVVGWFSRSAHELRAAGVDAGLGIAAQAMTRHRLRARIAERSPA